MVDVSRANILDPYRLPVVLCYLLGLCALVALRVLVFPDDHSIQSYAWVYAID
eukprot:g15580.t1